MKKTIIIIAVLAVIGLGIYYMTSNKGSSGTPNIPAPAIQSKNMPTPISPVSNTPTLPTPSSITISIKNFSFNPSTQTIKTGTRVTWVNEDPVSHTITSDSGNLLNSKILSPGQSFDFIFTNPGSVGYHCNIHPMMKGNIIVAN